MKKLVLIGLVLTILGSVSCKDSESDPAPNTSTGKLSDSDKAKLYNKKWQDHLGAFTFEYNTGGEFIMNDGLVGTWSWRGKSDTMDLKNNGDSWAQIWVSVTENEAKYRTNQSGLGFKDVFTLTAKP